MCRALTKAMTRKTKVSLIPMPAPAWTIQLFPVVVVQDDFQGTFQFSAFDPLEPSEMLAAMAPMSFENPDLQLSCLLHT